MAKNLVHQGVKEGYVGWKRMMLNVLDGKFEYVLDIGGWM